MSNLHNSVENDFDSFFNLENTDYTPSPATKSTPSLAYQSSGSSSTFATSQPSFAAPSYQYDSHRQQTGLPTGGLANTFAVNQASGLHYRPNSLGFVMPTETLNVNTPLSGTLDDFDFGRNQSMDMSEMDFDADSPSDVTSMFYGQGESSASAPIQRIYPGMHAQQAAQAAQAKAAQAQKHQELLRQRQQKALQGQQPLPTQAPKAPSAKDPHVEESISRLLSRMRQSSSASADEASMNANSAMSNMPRTKKEEEDMDEDERLLASEEGKKLSSKERRQLRNKVSARAFRSRRKEYIGQLEAEVQQKVQEANDLRVQNRQLMEENNRLTDLTRMLLSSQAFSGFLQELSNSGLPAPQISQTPTSQPSQPAQSRKDVSLHEAARQLQNQNQSTIGMAMIPEVNSNLNGMDGNWGSLASNDFTVFSVTSLPAPPALDLGALSRQTSASGSTSAKNIPELPTLPPPMEEAEPTVTESEIESTTTTTTTNDNDLYSMSVATSSVTLQSAEALIASLRKPDFELASQSRIIETQDVGSWESLNDLCSAMEDTCQRLVKHLPVKKE